MVMLREGYKYMSFIKRGFLAVIRKPIKSLLLIALLYCVSTLMMVGISASDTSTYAQREARNNVGAHLIMGLDMEDYYRRIEQLEEDGYDLTVYPEPPATQIAMQAPPNFEFMSLKMEDIEELAKIEGVKDYNVEAMMNNQIKAVDFKRVEGKFSGEEDSQEITLHGVRELSLMSIVQDGSIVLIDGRLIQADDVGKLVISEELARLNQLQVGDRLTLETLPMIDTMMLEVMERFGFKEPVAVQITGEVVGIFRNNRSISFQPGIVSRSSENTIFSDLDFPKVGVHENDPFYEWASFHVTDVDAIEEVEQKLRSVDIDWQRYILIENQETALELSSTFEQLQEMGSLLLGVALSAGFTILTLVLIFLMKGRSHEVGIWLALGTTKKGIAFQMIWETLIAVIVAMFICLITIPTILGGAEKYFNKQVASQEQIMDEQLSEDIFIQNEEEEQEKIVLTVTMQTALFTMGITMVLIVIAVSFAMIPIFLLKPREIFARLS